MFGGWVFPALLFGAGLYIKQKQKAGKFRWIAQPEGAVKAMPVILAVAKSESGEALPEPPQGFRWKEIVLMYAASPLSAPSEARIHVLEQWLNNAPAGANSFVSLEGLGLGDLGRHRRHHGHGRRGGWGGGWWGPPVYVPYEEPVYIVEDPAFLTKEALERERKRRKLEELLKKL